MIAKIVLDFNQVYCTRYPFELFKSQFPFFQRGGLRSARSKSHRAEYQSAFKRLFNSLYQNLAISEPILVDTISIN